MSNRTLTLSAESAGTYIDHLQSLILELQRAIGALAGNQLSVLEWSVTGQEILCARLKQLTVQSVQMWGDLATDKETSLDLTRRIDQARTTLLFLHKQYAALLEHSRESLRIFSGLYRPYGGDLQGPVIANLNRPTWSSEL